MQGSSYRLIVRRGPQPNQIYPLDKAIVTLGRDITNEIVINDPEVSRHHCRLTQGGGGFTIEDLSSTNGTFVNGQRLTGARPLAPGDMIGLGETVTLAYESSMAVAPGEMRPGATMVAGSAPADYGGRPVASGYNAQGAPSAPSAPGAYPGYTPPAAQPYGAPQQQPMSYDYDYQEEPYEGGGTGRWVILGCGCFLVICIVSTIIGGIIVDLNCWWDDLPVISDMFDLGVKPDATCR
jgi:hypothetical protein